MRDLKVCFDSGHAHLDGNALEAVEILRGLIASTHLHDNAGTKDDHLLPGEGKVAWEKLIPALRRQSSEVALLLEARNDGGPASLEKIAAAAKRLEMMPQEPTS
jgi:sugar phosphate isomerase/epimerase